MVTFVKKLFLVALAIPFLAGAAEKDALAIEARILNRHLPYGTIVDPAYTTRDSNDIAGYSRCGDSALWTGHYIAAESFRYAVTRSAEAHKNIMDALQGIRMLLDVTGTDVLARCAFPENSPYANWITGEESHNGVHTGLFDGKKYIWIGNTSRDQYIGVFFGLTAAWNLTDSQDVHDAAAWLTTRLLDRLQSDHWLIRMPDGTVVTTFAGRADQQLALLKLGRRVNGKFANAYKSLSTFSSAAAIAPIALEVTDPYNSYFKFNLDHITFWDLLTSGDSFWVRISYQRAFDILRNTTDDHQNAFFNLIDRAINGPDNPKRDADARAFLDLWLQRPDRNPYTDVTGQYAQCYDHACQPIPVDKRPTTDFTWQRSPFQFAGGGDGTIEGAGLDYILPYWMGRYYGVVTN